MTQSDSPESPDQLKATHPITDRIEGWYFRVTERSPGCHYAEAINAKGRKVSANGPDAESALSLCARDVELRMKQWAACRRRSPTGAATGDRSGWTLGNNGSAWRLSAAGAMRPVAWMRVRV